MKRKMTKFIKEKALEYVKDKIDNGDNLYIIYVSKDSNIIIYEDLNSESITICSKYLTKIKEVFARDLEDTFLTFYLSEYLQEYYISEYVEKIVNDYKNTDLEEYEVMKWSE